MPVEGYKINYIKFEPNLAFKRLINEMVQQIQAQAPSDSQIRLDVEPTGTELSAKMTITASCGSFEAQTIKNTQDELCETLHSKVNKQLADWKESRTLGFI